MKDLINIRTLAHQFLIKQGIHKLYITYEELEEICQNLGYDVRTYNEAENIIEKLNLQESTKRDSFTYNKNNVMLVLIRGDLSYGRKIRVLAHEIGHIYIGHKSHCGIIGDSSDHAREQQQEDEANTFAYEIIATTCVLRKLKIYSTAQITSYTFLNHDDSEEVLHNLKFFKSLPTDTKVLEQYKDFIEEYTPPNNYLSTGKLILGLISAFGLGICVTLLIISLYYRNGGF